jgi:hypothetical protein
VTIEPAETIDFHPPARGSVSSNISANVARLVQERATRDGINLRNVWTILAREGWPNERSQGRVASLKLIIAGREPRISTLVALASVLGVEVWEILAPPPETSEESAATARRMARAKPTRALAWVKDGEPWLLDLSSETIDRDDFEAAAPRPGVSHGLVVWEGTAAVEDGVYETEVYLFGAWRRASVVGAL